MSHFLFQVSFDNTDLSDLHTLNLKVVFASPAQRGRFYFRILKTMYLLLQKKSENETLKIHQ